VRGNDLRADATCSTNLRERRGEERRGEERRGEERRGEERRVELVAAECVKHWSERASEHWSEYSSIR
jgi:hypothetical protein